MHWLQREQPHTSIQKTENWIVFVFILQQSLFSIPPLVQRRPNSSKSLLKWVCIQSQQLLLKLQKQLLLDPQTNYLHASFHNLQAYSFRHSNLMKSVTLSFAYMYRMWSSRSRRAAQWSEQCDKRSLAPAAPCFPSLSCCTDCNSMQNLHRWN